MLQHQLRAAHARRVTSLQRFAPVAFLADAVRRYALAHDLSSPRLNFQRVVVDPVRGLQIAAAYLAAPWFDDRSVAAYHAFRDETVRQFTYLTAPLLLGGLGVNVESVTSDPYPHAAAMAEDLRHRRQLKVWDSDASDNPHPLLTDDENTMFRAVHDAFAHAAAGVGFDRHGEEAAWLKHTFMYSATARPALTTETRGQSSAMVFGNSGGSFPEQKAILLPAQFADPANVTLTPP